MNQAVTGRDARRLHSRLLTVAEMQARDLMRRHVAMGLLLVLPLAFYGSLAGTRGRHAMGAGGVGERQIFLTSVSQNYAISLAFDLGSSTPGSRMGGRLVSPAIADTTTTT